ncbi:MAG: hypothetical protein IPK32_05045 [Verrucomicrobiaceae bacterium]|nr:hypothetical protein [Verrucomicrobiaceae bacterium]
MFRFDDGRRCRAASYGRRGLAARAFGAGDGAEYGAAGGWITTHDAAYRAADGGAIGADEGGTGCEGGAAGGSGCGGAGGWLGAKADAIHDVGHGAGL